MNRREFINGVAACGACAALDGCCFSRPRPLAAGVPSYWCTWCREVERAEKLGIAQARDTIDENALFGADGWARFFPKERGDLLLVIDDGWDVGYGLDPWKGPDMTPFGSLEPDAKRFASFGDTPSARLKGIAERTKDFGWKGLGIWVACQCFGDTHKSCLSAAATDEWLKRKLDESARAGVAYWKVDWGIRDENMAFRARMSELKRRYYPELLIEHKPLHGAPLLPANFPTAADCPFNREVFAAGDVVRTYDVLPPFSLVTTLSRVAAYSKIVDVSGSRTVLNVEDEVVVGAVLGHAFGIMRGPDDRPDEVAAAVRWQRVAPAFGGDAGLPTLCSETAIVERKTFGPDEGWYAGAKGKSCSQSAPAVIARGMALPSVRAVTSEVPFVAVGRNPNGSMAVAQLPRHVNGQRVNADADIELAEVLTKGQRLAVFGSPHQLRVRIADDVRGLKVENLVTGAVKPIPQDWLRDGWLTLSHGALPDVAYALSA